VVDLIELYIYTHVYSRMPYIHIPTNVYIYIYTYIYMVCVCDRVVCLFFL